MFLFLFACVLGKESVAEVQGLLMEFTQTKTKENLSLVDDNKVRLWQDSQTMDSNSEVKTSNPQQRNDTENSDKTQSGLESEPAAESQTRPQETSKKTKRKKAKSKKAESLDMLRNGQKGKLVEVVGRRRGRKVTGTSVSATSFPGPLGKGPGNEVAVSAVFSPSPCHSMIFVIPLN